MATLKQCDKCGKTDANLEVLSLSLPKPGYNFVPHEPLEDVLRVNLDLCKRCVQRLSEWLRPDVQEATHG